MSTVIEASPTPIVGKWIVGSVARQANAAAKRIAISGTVSLRRSKPGKADEKSQMQKQVRATIQINGSRLDYSTIETVGYKAKTNGTMDLAMPSRKDIAAVIDGLARAMGATA